MNSQPSKTNFQILIVALVILNLVLPDFVFAQEKSVQVPETLEEAKSFGFSILNKLPNAARRVWREEALPQLKKMWDIARGPLESLWNKFLSLLGKEVEKRKPILEEEFAKEKEEMREDLPKTGQSIWERFKALLD